MEPELNSHSRNFIQLLMFLFIRNNYVYDII